MTDSDDQQNDDEGYKLALEEARRQLDSQANSFQSTINKSITFLKLNLIVLGALVTAIPIAAEYGINVDRFTNIYTASGFVFLIISITSSIAVIASTKYKSGISGDVFGGSRANKIRYNPLLNSYKQWISFNKDSSKRQAIFFAIATNSFLDAFIMLSIGIFGVFTSISGGIPILNFLITMSLLLFLNVSLYKGAKIKPISNKFPSHSLSFLPPNRMGDYMGQIPPFILIFIILTYVLFSFLIYDIILSFLMSINILVGIITILRYLAPSRFSGSVIAYMDFKSQRGDAWFQTDFTASPEDIDYTNAVLNSYPTRTILVILISQFLLIGYRFAGGEFSSQSYGVIYSLGGSGVLILERIRSGPYSSMDIKRNAQGYLETVWGFSLLAVGFFAQILAMLL